MKFFTVFAAILAMSMASPAEWSLNELSAAIQDPSTPAALKPILEEALNQLMLQIVSGSPQTTTTVSTAVQDFSAWTLHELSEAIQDPSTDAQLVIYLEHALNSLLMDIMSGGQPEYIIVATPVGLLPVDTVVIPAPVETEVPPPTPVESVVAPSSPLVQIIVNIKSQQQTPIGVETPVVPAPVIVAPEIIDQIVVPEPVVLPPPVLPEVSVPETNPVDVISVNPEAAVNPIDVIAITAPEVNPIDLIAPVPVVVSPIVAGPMI